ncbi:HNHc domain containing protein [uncultured Caudovirales phage]|uniref:HNHc domain containing protein n=1 Tax=uncultured Caudovirales phage TaxID=2100421 RepID=A0A6J5RKG4_9CAUD|nr:HNHc domain containing protein [uncultured Caudovirales phage]
MTQRHYNSKQYKDNRAQVLADNPQCYICGRNAQTVDHLLEVDRGGTHDIENLAPCCTSCNSRRGQKYGETKKQMKKNGDDFFIPPTDDPALFLAVSLEELAGTGENQSALPQVNAYLPRLETTGYGTLSYGPQVVSWAKTFMGLDLFEWQAHALFGQLAHDENGDLLFRESLVSTARQNGKSIGLQALIGWWLTEMPKLRGKPQSILSVANRLDRAESLFNALAPMLVELFGGKAMRTFGRKSVEMPDGSMWEVRSSSPNLHGGSYDLVAADELFNISDRFMDAIRPTMIARKSPLLSTWSTAGDESSVAMIHMRETAINEIEKSERSRLYFAEWSIGDRDWRDPQNWIYANPCLGKTITIEALQAVSKKDSFLRAHLNMWVSSRGSWLEEGVWASCKIDGPMPVGGVLAVEMSMDTNRYVAVRSSMFDGVVTTFVEFIVDNEASMWAEVDRVMADKLVALAITPTLEIHAPLSLRRRMTVVGQAELIKFTGLAQKMILEGRVKHLGQLTLSEHMNRAVMIKTGAGVTLSHKSSPGPIELAKCAVWGIALSSKYQNRAKPMMVVS